VYHAAVSGEFRMAEATLTAYRQLRFRANARPRVVIVPIGFVCWDDEYPAGEPPIPSGDPAAYDTLAELYAARGHYWEMGMIPDQFQELWHTAHEQMPNWPGFQRLYVDDETKRLAEYARKDEAGFWEAAASLGEVEEFIDPDTGMTRVSAWINLRPTLGDRLRRWCRRLGLLRL